MGNIFFFFYRFGGSETAVIPFTSMLFRNSTFILRLFFLLEPSDQVHVFSDGLLLLDDDDQHWCYPMERLWDSHPSLKHTVTSSAARWLRSYLDGFIRPRVAASG